GVAARADKGDHVKPKLGVRQDERAFRLGAVGTAVPLTGAVGTGADLQGAGDQPRQGGHGAVVGVGNPEGTATNPAVVTAGRQMALDGRFGTGMSAGHQLPPWGLVSPPPHALPTRCPVSIRQTIKFTLPA